MDIPITTVLGSSDRPLVLLPVRLETRFFGQADGSSELRVRIYPDKIHIDAHERDLTPTEREWGQHYWDQARRAATDTRAQAAAWRQVATRFGANRAAWIVHQVEGNTAFLQDEDAPAWRHAPLARLLPRRWVAVLHSGSQPPLVAASRDVQSALAVGPDPQATSDDQPDGPQAVEAGMRWMTDFAAAEGAGMALRISVPAAVVAAGLDSVVVFGIRDAAADATATELADLLDAHHYGDGLAFLNLGTPSNNTAEQRAGYTSEQQQEQTFVDEIQTDPTSLGAETNALWLGHLLGLPPDRAATALGRLNNAGRSHELNMRSMNAALWEVTWGYFLSNLVGFDGTGLTPDGLAWARDHFITHVRHTPLPPLRCGRQPYGVLPVTSLDLWQPDSAQPDADRESWLKDFLVRARDNLWRPHLDDVPRIGKRQGPADAEADLADVMRTEGVSNSFRARAVLGRHYLQHLRAFIGENLQASGFLGAHDAMTAGVLRALGITDWQPRVARGTFAESAWPVNVPLVQAGEVWPGRPLEPNYLAALLADARVDTLRTTQATTLLHALVRHAWLREYANAAGRLLGGPGATRDDELVDLVDGAPPTTTWLRQLDSPLPGATDGRTVRQYLETLTTFDTPPLAALGEFRAGVAHLQTLDADALQLLLSGTLDLAGHRLDAWVTSLAHRRLADMRASAPQGVYVGGYGWLENLRPAAAPPQPAQAPDGEQGPVFEAADRSGFIHAPSLAHAATAALLRNAHLGASGVPTEESPFAIDLSSRKVRDAVWLLDGVRQGQPLGALLGYRFERALHVLGLDRFIQPIRALAPLVAGRLQPTTAALETIAANNVVDGLALHARWRTTPFEITHLLLDHAQATPAENTSITRELDALGEVIDALSDALTAETAYQAVRGNTARAAGTLQAIARGEAPPPELEVARFPRSGIASTYRVAALFPAGAAPVPGWPEAGTSVRARSEPRLNAWAGRLLGDPRRVRCTVRRLDPDGTVVERRSFPLSDLSLNALDVVYGVGTSLAADPTGSSDLEQLVLYQARRQHPDWPLQAVLRLDHTRPGDLGPGELTLADVLEQAAAAQRLFASARSLDTDDLAPPDRSATGTIDLEDLESRVAAAEQALASARQTVADLLAQTDAASSEALRAAILAFGALGVPAAVPVTATGEAAAPLLTQATVLLKTVDARLAQSATLAAQAPASDPRVRREQLSARMRSVLGDAFLAIAPFTCAPETADQLAHALADSTRLQGGDPLAVSTWLLRAERVREPTARLARLVRAAEVLETGERLKLSVAQLPFNADEQWVGLPFDADAIPPTNKLSLIVQQSVPADVRQPLAGLFVDEWIDLVPARSESTALTFQYDPPNAFAPQSILVAVPPDPKQPWTVGDLHRVLIETLDLAKLRGIDMESLTDVAQFLPAAFLAFNARDDVVSTDFAPLTR